MLLLWEIIVHVEFVTILEYKGAMLRLVKVPNATFVLNVLKQKIKTTIWVVT